MLRIILMQRRVSSPLYIVEKEKEVLLYFSESLGAALAQSIPCTNTFSRETPANVRSKAMNVAVENEVNGASRPNDKYDKPSRKSHEFRLAHII